MAKDLLNDCKNNNLICQTISYDDTYDVSSSYSAALVMKNTRLQNNPMFPVAFFLHSSKASSRHQSFFDYLKFKNLNYENVCPIITDREASIRKCLINCKSHFLQYSHFKRH